MKALREFFIIILSFLLIGMITCLGVFVSFRNIVNTSIGGEVVKNMVATDDMSEEEKQKIDDAIDKVTSYKGTQEVIDSVLNDINSSSDGNITISDETLDKFIQLIEDNKQELIDLGATEQDINELIKDAKDPENRSKIQEGINAGYQELNVDTGNQSYNIIKTYSSIASPKAIIRLGTSIGIVVMLIMLLSWSWYKWIRPTSISSIIAGLNLLIVYYGIGAIVDWVVNDSDVSFNVDTSILRIVSHSVFFGGIAALIIYIVINNVMKKNNKSIKNVDTNNTVVTGTQIEQDPINPDKFCASCGSGVTKETTVCPKCGAPLD
jgi:hypothetical protein